MTFQWQNSKSSFGLISKLFHWFMVLLIFGLIGLGLYLTNFKIGIAQLFLYAWHKSLGILVLVLVCARYSWHLYTRPPPPLPAPNWQLLAARAVHVTLYVLLLVIPLSGWSASSASGFPMSFFGLFEIPNIAPQSRDLEELFFTIHRFATRALFVVLALHIAGALHRHYALRDGTSRRMWF